MNFKNFNIPLVSIIIVNYNNKRFLTNCLKLIFRVNIKTFLSLGKLNTR